MNLSSLLQKETIVHFRLSRTGCSLRQLISDENMSCGHPYFKCERRGVATKFWLGGRIHRHSSPSTPKFWFFLGFRSLYLENVGKCKKLYVSRENILKYPNFPWGEGSSPADIKSSGVLTHATPRRIRPCVNAWNRPGLPSLKQYYGFTLDSRLR